MSRRQLIWEGKWTNSFKNDSNFDLLGDFWNQFWRIFANKMNMGNNLNIETLFEKEQKNISKISYIQKNLSLNFTNNNNISSYNNNVENLKTIGNLTKNRSVFTIIMHQQF